MVSNIEYCSPLGKSDHSLLTFNFNCYIQQENTERVKYYYDKADFSGMKTEISTIDWVNELKDKDINEQWATFKDKLHSLQDRYVPKRKPRPTSDKKGKCSLDFKTLKTIRKKITGAGLDLWRQEMQTSIENTAKYEIK